MADMNAIVNSVCGPHGSRPPLNDLPTDTPPAIVDMIQFCWHHDRLERLSAMQCLGIVHQCRDIVANSYFDIFLSHRWAEKGFVRHLYKHLVDSGYRVWYDEIHMGHDMAYSMQRGIEKSKVVVICASPGYQNGDNTMFELRYARNYIDTETGRPKPIITVSLEGRIRNWATDEMKQLCDIQTAGGTMYLDLSTVVTNYPRNAADDRNFQVRSQIINYSTIYNWHLLFI